MPIFTGSIDGLAKMAAKDMGWVREVEERMKRYGISHASFNVNEGPTPDERADLLASRRERRSERAVKARKAAKRVQ